MMFPVGDYPIRRTANSSDAETRSVSWFLFFFFRPHIIDKCAVLSALLQSPTIGSRQSIPHSIYDESVLAPKKMTYGCSAARPPFGRAQNEGEDGQCLPFKAQGPPSLPLSSGDGDTSVLPRLTRLRRVAALPALRIVTHKDKTLS